MLGMLGGCLGPVLGQMFPRLKKIQERRQKAAMAGVTPRPAARCGGELNAGYRVTTFSSGLRAAVWYPATAAEAAFGYLNGLSSSVASDAEPADCGVKYPVVIFSHGFGGCGTQTAFFTEMLARQGYVVVAPDHKDAKCRVDQPGKGNLFARPEEPFQRPEEWSDATYRDRREDVRLILTELGRQRMFSGAVDMSRVAGAGHSLGGYTMLGLAGAWDSWRDERIKAIVLFSPYVAPYVAKQRAPFIRVPVMYQGGTRDSRITPDLRRAGGMYEMTKSPKYYVELKDFGHFDWTVMVCGRGATAAGCADTGRARPVNQYAIPFLNHYVKGTGPAPDGAGRAELADFRSKE
jgi:predicted dienelactone hydrolase